MGSMMKSWKALTLAGVTAMFCGCAGSAGFFNPSFVNFVSGGVFPVTPGPSADYVMVRLVNDTGQVVGFFVTAEITRFARDEFDNVVRDDFGNPVTETVQETVELVTRQTGQANELGVLFSCAEERIDLIGLGETLTPDEPAVFVIPNFVPSNPLGLQTGFGVGSDLSPLSLAAGNFSCGDTIIYRAIRAVGVPGEVRIEVFLLPGSEQPGDFSGSSTFANYQAFLETQNRDR